MTTVYKMLLQKGNVVWSVTPNTSIHETLRLLSDRKIGAALVMDEENIVGILSERDIAREFAKADTISLKTPVHMIMTKVVFYISPDMSAEDCMALMTEKHIRHLPVVENGKVIGLISIGDVVKETIFQKDIAIRSLENYILGRDYNQ